MVEGLRQNFPNRPGTVLHHRQIVCKPTMTITQVRAGGQRTTILQAPIALH